MSEYLKEDCRHEFIDRFLDGSACCAFCGANFSTHSEELLDEETRRTLANLDALEARFRASVEGDG